MPGLLDDIITDHAGTVMGGSHERSGPCTPFRQRHFKFGKSSSQRSNTNSGAAQSSPMSMTRGRAFPGGACKAASRVDSGEKRFFKSFRYQAMNAHWCLAIERRPRGPGARPSSKSITGSPIAGRYSAFLLKFIFVSGLIYQHYTFGM